MFIASFHGAKLCLRDPDSCLAVLWSSRQDRVEVRRWELSDELGPVLGVYRVTRGLPASAAVRQLRRILAAHHGDPAAADGDEAPAAHRGSRGRGSAEAGR